MDLIVNNLVLKEVSYLQARDPSILGWNKHGLDKVRENLKDKLDEKSEQETNENHLQVYLRIKDGIPFEDLYQIKEETLVCRVPNDSYVLRNIKEGEKMTKTYSFSKIFSPGTKQLDIFNNAVKVKMLEFINGKNFTVLAYGASGSGKTFTIVGTSEEPGIIPRALEYIFRTIPKLKEEPKVIPLPNGELSKVKEPTLSEVKLQKSSILNATHVDRAIHIKTYKQMQQRLSSEVAASVADSSDVSASIWVSFAEIYNENIYDLLKASPMRGRPRPKLRLGYSNGTCFIKDLTSIPVSSGIEAYQILQYGLHNLNYASTSINSHSSRSHSIFTIKLIQSSTADNGVFISTFNFCDLAGSERLKKTMNMGDRLKESNNINTSLLVLGRCITNIRSAQQVHDNRLIPFRESKLTQLFQKALVGLEAIMMIVNINPSRDMFDESHHVLNFSAVAKEIVVEEQPKGTRPKKGNRFSQYMERKTASEQQAQEMEEDEKDAEINRLRIIVCNLYTEIENNKRDYEIEHTLDRNHIISNFREAIDRLVDEKLALRKECNELRAKIELLEQKEENDEDIICLDSSSDESPSTQVATGTEELEEIISELRAQVHTLELKVHDLDLERKKLEKEVQVLPALKEQNETLSEKVFTLNVTLRDAEVAYSDLQKELEEEKVKNKKLVSKTLQLQERVDLLENDLLVLQRSDNSS